MKPGPITVLTGATRGLGLAMAQQLAKEGGHLISLSRQPVAGLADLAQTHQTTLTEIMVDLVDASALEQAAEQMVKTLSESATQGCCRMIHNAGIVAPIDLASELTDLNAIRTAFDVNITAPIYLTGHFLAATQNCKDRRIMLVSSGAGRQAYQSWGVYCATKAAMDRYAEVINVEAHTNTRVASVAPGVIDTDMQAQIRSMPESKFPAVDRFVELHQQGALTPASTTARAMLDLLQSDFFGRHILDDVRTHTS